MTDFDTDLPSVRQVQDLIKRGKRVEVKLITGDVAAGKVLWQDPHCLCLAESDQHSSLVWRSAIAYLKVSE